MPRYTSASPDDQKSEYIPMLPKNRSRCVLITDIVALQCILVFLGATTIMFCFWTPDSASMDYDKLARIMYLFDSKACGYTLKLSKAMSNVRFSNDTKGYSDIRPIQWKELTTAVSTKLSGKTRTYIKLSSVCHFIWFLIAVVTRLFLKKSTDLRYLKGVLTAFFYSCLIMLIFDISMALVYISDIKQSLSKGMILRYSGWSGNLKLNSYEEFAGWLPLAASCCWLRGIVLFSLNIYCTRSLILIRRKIRRREIKKKYENERYRVIPDCKSIKSTRNTLIYKASK